jgi:LPS-assembly lipoprotein
VSRDYFFNAQQVLAKEAEESRLRDYIQNDLAELILLRLEAVLPATGKP